MRAASIGTVTVRMPRFARERVGVGDAALAREARRHEHADHVLGPERVDRDRRDQRRVDAAGEPDEHVGEAVLAHVVAGAEHERLVHLVHRRRAAARSAAASRRSPRRASLTATSGSAPALRPPARVEQAAPERGADVDVDDEQVLLELRGAGDEPAALVEQHRRAVEDELVLPADEVHVEHGHRRVGGAGGEHRLAFVDAARVERRRVDVHDELRAARGLGDDRAVRAPRVLADRDRDAHAARRRTADRRRSTARSSAARRTPRSSGAGACGTRRARCPFAHTAAAL